MAQARKELGESFGTHFPASTKVYSQGPIHGVRVPFRTIELNPSRTADGSVVENPSHCVYDTSGPWTDPDMELDVRNGLPGLRTDWIEAHGDTETYEGRGFCVGDDGKAGAGTRQPFPGLERRRRRSVGGGNVTQMHYARRGIVTPEMEFVALRENLGRDAAFECAYQRNGEEGLRGDAQTGPTSGMNHQHPGRSWGAAIPQHITPEFVRDEVARGRAIIPSNINHPESEPMIIGRNFRVKINANIGNSAVTSTIEE